MTCSALDLLQRCNQMAKLYHPALAMRVKLLLALEAKLVNLCPGRQHNSIMRRPMLSVLQVLVAPSWLMTCQLHLLRQAHHRCRRRRRLFSMLATKLPMSVGFPHRGLRCIHRQRPHEPCRHHLLLHQLAQPLRIER